MEALKPYVDEITALLAQIPEIEDVAAVCARALREHLAERERDLGDHVDPEALLSSLCAQVRTL
jgi:hypothetical protein